MEVSLKPKVRSRSKVVRIAAAIGFALVIGSFVVGPARADEHGHDHHGYYQHRDNEHRGYNRGYRGGYERQPMNNYYAPEPNYYAAPEPYEYNDSPRYRSPVSQGLDMFFGR
ncbi:MAG TPA: hypothetical protein VND20_06365 [Candidatus Binataceae bacterium]|nr:hypothetical protein [Candidatus Binataceae bacterium]